MISKREFLVIGLMMAAIFLLFQAPQFIKDLWNNYDTNEYQSDSAYTSGDLWVQEPEMSENERFVVYVGKSDSKTAQNVRLFAANTRQKFETCEKLSDYKVNANRLPGLMFIDDSCFVGDYLTVLNAFADAGIDMVFTDVAKSRDLLAYDYDLDYFLGIQQEMERTTEVDGIELVKGFLLGGDRVYRSFDERSEKLNDLNLSMPWFITDAGTKTYAFGLKQDESGRDLDNNKQPAIIWRRGTGTSQLYCINGDYLEDRQIALGIIQAIDSNRKSFDIYPVVNAQTLMAVNYPVLSDENGSVMDQIYSRTQTDFQKTIVLPSISAIVEQSKFHMTDYALAQYDFSDANKPDIGVLTYYLQRMREQKAEAGISLIHGADSSLGDIIASSNEILSEEHTNYPFRTVFTSENDVTKALELLATQFDAKISVVGTDKNDEKPFFEYADEDTTVIRATNEAEKHTFTDELRLIGMETALGYSNTCMNMLPAFWPENTDEQWQNMSEVFSSNLTSYWKDFSKFDMTTMSETDAHVRAYMALDYFYSRRDNNVTLHITNFKDAAYFIVRTHGEQVSVQSGGEVSEIEENVYLLHATKKMMRLTFSENETFKKIGGGL